MDISVEEQHLLGTFRRLTPAGRQELLHAADAILQKHREEPATAGAPTQQCNLEKKEERPEAAKEPVFTE